MSKPDKIKQPNHISTARFTLTVLEKNIIYIVLDQLQQKMTLDLNQEYYEQEIIVELKELDKNRNYSHIKNAIKSLASKQVEFELGIPNGGKTHKIQEIVTSLISGLKYERHSEYISFMIPSSACRFFCYIGGGYTNFQKTIAISLSSNHSKCLYELCCRWIDRGGFSCSIKKFKILMGISGKYKQISHLRTRVLDDSMRELKSKADIFFTYSLVKTGRCYTDIHFKFHRNQFTNDGFNGVREKHYRFVYNFLHRFFPDYESDSQLVYLDAITKANQLSRAYYRFVKLDDDLTSGKRNKTDIRNLLEKVILKELGA